MKRLNSMMDSIFLNIKITIFLFLLFIVSNNDLYGVDSSGKKENKFLTVKQSYITPKIQIVGNRKVNSEMIENIWKKNVQYHVSDSSINKFLVAMYNTNLFSDIKVTFDKKTSILNVKVQENKIVRNLEIKGIKEIKNLNGNELKKLSESKRMTIYNEYDINQTIKQIHEFYVELGYVNVGITKDVIDVADDMIDVIVTVKKQKKLKIEQIDFIGNKSFSKEELADVTFFQEYSFLKFFSSKSMYNKNLEPQNNELLAAFYLKHGYIDFKLLNSKINYDFKKNRTHITFEIEEGNKYKIKDIRVESDIKFENEVYKKINENIGVVYNQQKIDIIQRLMKSYLNSKKYYSDIKIEKQKLSNNEVIVTYKINEVKSNYIEKIIIQGNTRTKDSVIRNQISLHEGDIFDVSEIQTSYRRVYNLGFFETVNIDYQKSKENKIILIVSVKEKKTGELNIGAGYSSINGLYGKLYYVQNNLLGTGDSMSFGIERGAHSFSVQASYFKNNIFNSLLGGGIGSFYSKEDNDRLDFKKMDVGVKLMTGIPLYKDLGLSLQYLLKSTDIYDLKKGASQYVKLNEGKTISSIISYKLDYDKRDVADYPTNGYLVELSQTIAGFGGDKKYLSTEIMSHYYKTLFYYNDTQEADDAVVLQLKDSYGYMYSYGDYNLKIDDRFFLGEMRGFEMISGISPRDKQGKAIGGDEYFFGSAQVEFPIKLFKELDIKGHLFIDYGTLINTNKLLLDPALDIKEQLSSNDSRIRVSAGAGFTIDTPIAPIGIDFGIPIVRDKSDIINHVYFSIAKRF